MPTNPKPSSGLPGELFARQNTRNKSAILIREVSEYATLICDGNRFSKYSTVLRDNLVVQLKVGHHVTIPTRRLREAPRHFVLSHWDGAALPLVYDHKLQEHQPFGCARVTVSMNHPGTNVEAVT